MREKQMFIAKSIVNLANKWLEKYCKPRILVL